MLASAGGRARLRRLAASRPPPCSLRCASLSRRAARPPLRLSLRVAAVSILAPPPGAALSPLSHPCSPARSLALASMLAYMHLRRHPASLVGGIRRPLVAASMPQQALRLRLRLGDSASASFAASCRGFGGLPARLSSSSVSAPYQCRFAPPIKSGFTRDQKRGSKKGPKKKAQAHSRSAWTEVIHSLLPLDETHLTSYNARSGSGKRASAVFSGWTRPIACAEKDIDAGEQRCSDTDSRQPTVECRMPYAVP